jgi:hypothetical protein
MLPAVRQEVKGGGRLEKINMQKGRFLNRKPPFFIHHGDYRRPPTWWDERGGPVS